MNGKNETTAVKRRQKRALCWTLFLSAAVILYLLPKELLMETLARIQRMGPQALEFMWRVNRGPLYGLLIFAGLALVCVICLVRILVLTARIRREPDNVPANARAQEKAARTERTNAAAQSNSKVPVLIAVTVAVIMVFAMTADEENMIPALSTIAITFAIAGVSLGANKAKKGAAPTARPVPQRRRFEHADEAEEVITCAHHTGKEKYIEQLESYLKAGLIDKAEYKVLKDRYNKLDIPEDYH